jgi:alkylation response protein AidB-like acyl-CoA dehydrogenase
MASWPGLQRRPARPHGTGSHDYTVNDVFVPEEYRLPLEGFSPPARQPGALYRVPLPTAFASCVAAVTLGIARAAIQEMMKLAGAKKPVGSVASLQNKLMIQADIARAEARLQGCLWPPPRTSALGNANLELVGRVFLGLDPGTDRF